MAGGNYPPGVDNGHPHFNPEQITCPSCGQRTVIGPHCENCDAPLDDDLVRDVYDDEHTPPEWQ